MGAKGVKKSLKSIMEKRLKRLEGSQNTILDPSGRSEADILREFLVNGHFVTPKKSELGHEKTGGGSPSNIINFPNNKR